MCHEKHWICTSISPFKFIVSCKVFPCCQYLQTYYIRLWKRTSISAWILVYIDLRSLQFSYRTQYTLRPHTSIGDNIIIAAEQWWKVCAFNTSALNLLTQVPLTGMWTVGFKVGEEFFLCSNQTCSSQMLLNPERTCLAWLWRCKGAAFEASCWWCSIVPSSAGFISYTLCTNKFFPLVVLSDGVLIREEGLLLHLLPPTSPSCACWKWCSFMQIENKSCWIIYAWSERVMCSFLWWQNTLPTFFGDGVG